MYEVKLKTKRVVLYIIERFRRVFVYIIYFKTGW